MTDSDRELYASARRSAHRLRPTFATPSDFASYLGGLLLRVVFAVSLLVILALLSTFLSGCGSLQEGYVRADAYTYSAVADEYTRYVEADANLDEDQKASRADTIASWRARLDAALDALAAEEDERQAEEGQ